SPTDLDGWDITGVAALASDDVWWWANRGSLSTALLHWNGASLSRTSISTAVSASLYSAAIVDGRWWLVGTGGAVYTRDGDAALRAIVDPGDAGFQAMWGAASDDMYFARGGTIRHWDGTAMTTIPIAAGRISGVRGT